MRDKVRRLTVVACAAALVMLPMPVVVAQTEEASPTPTAVPGVQVVVQDSAQITARQEAKPLVTDGALLALLVVVVVTGMGLLTFTVWKTSKSPAGGAPFRPQVEGMVLSMVVVAVIVLGVTGKLTDEGLASVLAAIVGYAVGRSTSSDGHSNGGNEAIALDAAVVPVTDSGMLIVDEGPVTESTVAPDPPDDPEVAGEPEAGS